MYTLKVWLIALAVAAPVCFFSIKWLPKWAQRGDVRSDEKMRRKLELEEKSDLQPLCQKYHWTHKKAGHVVRSIQLAEGKPRELVIKTLLARTTPPIA